MPRQFLLLISIIISLSSIPALAADCGSPGQRACCVGEPPTGGGCVDSDNNGDVIEVPYLIDIFGTYAETCGGFNPLGITSNSYCATVAPCGGLDERSCCLGESTFGACEDGLVENYRNNWFQFGSYCANSILGLQSAGICKEPTPCGGDGQRACCIGETSVSGQTTGGCDPGMNEVPLFDVEGTPLLDVPFAFLDAFVGQCSNLPVGVASSSVCVAANPCGSGVGQRACCPDEVSATGQVTGGCDAGLAETYQPNSGQCGNRVPGVESSGTCITPTPCGGLNQRACCLGEGAACDAGQSLTEVPGCQGNCLCGGVGPFESSGTCRATTSCGGDGQRACCLLEGNGGGCNSGQGLAELSGLLPSQEPGYCLNGVFGSQSISRCEVTTHCGQENERACCLGEPSPDGDPLTLGCEAGLVQVAQSNSGLCSGFLDVQSSGICEVVTDCGVAGERACCSGETAPGGQAVEAGGCLAGLITVPAENAGQCSNALPGFESSATCKQPTPCGGLGERACCNGEEGFGPADEGCDAGLVKVATQFNAGWCGNTSSGARPDGYCDYIQNDPNTSLQVVVSPASVWSTSEWPGSVSDGRASNLIDGSGLSGSGDVETQLHDNDGNAATMWHAGTQDGGLGGPVGNPPEVTSQALVFDLGEISSLTGAYVWNHNQTGLTSRGVADMEISVSSDSDPLTATFTSLGVVSFTQAAGLPGEPAQLFRFLAPNARLVRFEIQSAHSGVPNDYVGLSEVRFIKVVPATDSDSDGVPDAFDNCILVPNGPLITDAGGNSQLDTDSDGYGNLCDPDFDNSGIINASDLANLKTNFFTNDSNADLDGSGFVNAADLAILKQMFFGPPGPSGLVP